MAQAAKEAVSEKAPAHDKEVMQAQAVAPVKEAVQIKQTNAVLGETVTLPSGLQYTEQWIGSGREAKKGDIVVVHYTGFLAKTLDVFDSSIGKEPLKFKLGAGNVIKGWDEGVVGMKVGGKRKLMIPAKLAYGDKQMGPIPPNSDLLFDVELVRIPN